MIGIAVPDTEDDRVEAKDLDVIRTGLDARKVTIGRESSVGCVEETLVTKGGIASAIICDNACWLLEELGENAGKVVFSPAASFGGTGGGFRFVL